MGKNALSKLDDPLSDRRIEIARMILEAPEDRVIYLMRLYPEYFNAEPTFGSLEYIVNLNSSYRKWIEDTGVTSEWLLEFPTNEIYYRYLRYTVENRLVSMSKKLFFETLEIDFHLRR